MKLNAQGGIEIHVAAEKPDGVPPDFCQKKDGGWTCN